MRGSPRTASIRAAGALAALAALTVSGAVTVFAVAGCGLVAHDDGDATHAVNQAASARPGAPGPAGDATLADTAPVAAAEAGGACQLLNYDTIKQSLGVSFGVAAAAQRGGTFTCLVQPRGAGFPDLTLSVTATSADAQSFSGAMVPGGATGVAGLGKAGYSLLRPVAGDAGPGVGDAGPGVETGWLSGNQRLMVLRYQLGPTSTADDAAAAVSHLIELAKTIDFAGI